MPFRISHLSVRQAAIYQNAQWVDLFASPGLRGLTSLTLDWCTLTGPSGCWPLNLVFATAVFTSLSQLTLLRLKRTYGVDLMLPALHSAPALTELYIEACCMPRETSAPRVLPSFAVLLALLRARPTLRIVLDLRDHESPLRDEYVPNLAADVERAGVAAEVRSRLIVLYGKSGREAALRGGLNR